MSAHSSELLLPLRRKAKAHELLANEAAVIAYELDKRRHRGEAAIIRATARNHRIRQLELLANVAALEALFDAREPSRS